MVNDFQRIRSLDHSLGSTMMDLWKALGGLILHLTGDRTMVGRDLSKIRRLEEKLRGDQETQKGNITEYREDMLRTFKVPPSEW